jgi:undecaprenyl-diphosphatase
MALLLHDNYLLFMKINDVAGRWFWLDEVMIFCANMLIFCWPLLMLAMWGRPLSWRKRPLRPGELAIIHECRAVILWIGVACILSYLCNFTIEHFVFEPRPFVAHHVHLLVTHPADDSFPSDHAAWSFAVVGMMLFSLPSILRNAWRLRMASVRWQWGEARPLLYPLLLMMLAIVMACVIGVARVFVGVHYPGDIIGGAITGTVSAAIVTTLRSRVFQRPTGVVLNFAQRLRVA